MQTLSGYLTTGIDHTYPPLEPLELSSIKPNQSGILMLEMVEQRGDNENQNECPR